MPAKILVIYYTQTGQLKEIVRSITNPLLDNDITVTYKELKPKPPFPFPWSSDEFFQAMPESVKGIPCELEPLSLSGKENFDLIIVAWQPWYLSPSIPIHSFFQSETAKLLISGKPVITIIGSRNMWVMAHNSVKDYIKDAGGRLIGNIVLYDKAPNLLSVISVIRWMFKGKKERYMKIIPPSGVSEKDIKEAVKFGECIKRAINNDNLQEVGNELLSLGSVDVQPGLVMMERRAIFFFRIWADYILKKGSYGQKSRLTRIRLFKYYLLFVIYLVSPFASIIYAVLKPFRKGAIKKQVSLYQSN